MNHPSRPGGRTRTLQVSILSAFASLLLATVLVVVGQSYWSNTRAILDLSDDLLTQTTAKIIEKTVAYLTPASVLVDVTARGMRERPDYLADADAVERDLIGLLRFYEHPSLYVGDAKGRFVGVRRRPDGTVTTTIRTLDPPTQVLRHRDASGRTTLAEADTAVRFDPRERPWYKGAAGTAGQFWTDLYVFFGREVLGISASHPVFDADRRLLGVFGIDIELAEVSRFLSRRIRETGTAFILNERDELVAYPDVARIVRRDGDTLRPVRAEELGIAPVAAAVREHRRAGTERFTFAVDGMRYVGSFTAFPAEFGGRWRVGLVVPEDDFVGDVKRSSRWSLVISLGILLVAVLLARRVARSVSQPIEHLAEETRKIRDFRFDAAFDLRSSIREIRMMSEALTAMKSGLQAFGRYVPSGLVRQLIQTGEEAKLGGHRRELTVFFSDIVGFTTIAEPLPPEALMQHLSEYFELFACTIGERHGTVDKYIGDAVMAFWGAPLPDPDHAARACDAALVCQERLRERNAAWAAAGKPPLPTRIGIHTGDAVVGNIGAADRMNYTALGDTVNLASRLEGINNQYGTGIVVSATTQASVADRFVFRSLDVVAVKGKRQNVRIFELVCRSDDPAATQARQWCAAFDAAHAAYLARDWAGAADAFGRLTLERPDDRPTRLYVERCRQWLASPPAPDWDGAWHPPTK
jgi:adenylate cyclase